MPDTDPRREHEPVPPGRFDQDAPPVTDAVELLRDRTGLDVVGAFAFGDTPELQDELLGFVERGTKRATVGTVAEIEAEDGPFPAPGQHWGLLDGRGRPRYVMQTVEVTRGRLGDVTVAFAWDEGEDDRTLENWLDGHHRFFRRMGHDDPDELEVVFERFRIVWPEPDETVWLADGVRELRFDERDWVAQVYRERWGTTRVASRDRSYDVADLPGLVCERDGERVGVLTFRPFPGGHAEAVSVEAFDGGTGVEQALIAGFVELGRRHDWQRV